MTGQMIGIGARRRHVATRTLVLSIALSLGACRTDREDIERWATTVQGPAKLVAVLTHDKYPIDLRVEAALTLIRMKPRGGRRVGIQGSDEHPGLVAALSQMPPAARAPIVARLIPALEAEMQRAPEAGKPGAAPPPDESVPYKDAAFALLVHDKGRLVPDEKQRQRLRAALATWCGTDFARRMDDSSQVFSVEQVLRELKADGVRQLPDLIALDAPKLDRVAELIAELGDDPTKLRASERLVAVAQKTASDDWLQKKAPLLERLNRESKLKPSTERFRGQLRQYQEEELIRVFASMKRVGGQPVVEFLLGFAAEKSHSDKKRTAALAALQGKLSGAGGSQADKLLAIASAADTPDSVRDQALQRVGEFPRPLVVERLYALFKDPNWKVRWVAAELVLRMSDTSHLAEFFDRIGSNSEGMSITEPLRYGALIAAMKGPQAPVQIVQSRLNTGPAGARLTALGYYYHAGTLADLSQLAAMTGDQTKVPECGEAAKDCEWKCDVDVGGTRETKDIKTVGNFYEFCVKPALEKKQTEPSGKPAPQ